jgi:hypothetical protein
MMPAIRDTNIDNLNINEKGYKRKTKDNFLRKNTLEMMPCRLDSTLSLVSPERLNQIIEERCCGKMKK